MGPGESNAQNEQEYRYPVRLKMLLRKEEAPLPGDGSVTTIYIGSSTDLVGGYIPEIALQHCA